MKSPRFLLALDILISIVTAALAVSWIISAAKGNKSDYFFAALAALATVLNISRAKQRIRLNGHVGKAN